MDYRENGGLFILALLPEETGQSSLFPGKGFGGIRGVDVATLVRQESVDLKQQASYYTHHQTHPGEQSFDCLSTHLQTTADS